jgi:hypothetical protein
VTFTVTIANDAGYALQLVRVDIPPDVQSAAVMDAMMAEVRKLWGEQSVLSHRGNPG